MQEAHPTVNGKTIKTIVPVMSITSDISVYDLLKMRLPMKQAEIVNPGVDEKEPLLFPDKEGNIPIGDEQENKDAVEEQKKKEEDRLAKEKKGELVSLDDMGETEVKDEPGILSEDEAQKDQAGKLEHDKEWQDKTRRTWHNLVKRMYAINYFADEETYRAWMAGKFEGIKSYTELTDAGRVEGIGIMVGYANKYEQEKEK